MGVTTPPGGAGGRGGVPSASPQPQQGTGNQPQANAPRIGGGSLLPRNPIPPERIEDYKRAIELTGVNVTMMGSLIGANAMQLMRDVIQPVDTAQIWGARDVATCPGTARPDAPNAGGDRTIPLGLLRIGDIYLAAVNAELYSEIAMHLKAASPASKTMVVALGYGSGGYVRSDNALSHIAPQAAALPQSPCEGKIISKELELILRSRNN